MLHVVITLVQPLYTARCLTVESQSWTARLKHMNRFFYNNYMTFKESENQTAHLTYTLADL